MAKEPNHIPERRKRLKTEDEEEERAQKQVHTGEKEGKFRVYFSHLKKKKKLNRGNDQGLTFISLHQVRVSEL